MIQYRVLGCAIKVCVAAYRAKFVARSAPNVPDAGQPADVRSIEQDRHYSKRRCERVRLPEGHGHLQAEFIGWMHPTGKLPVGRHFTEGQAWIGHGCSKNRAERGKYREWVNVSAYLRSGTDSCLRLSDKLPHCILRDGKCLG